MSECIENAKLYAKKQMRRCPYCIQHSDDFITRYGQPSTGDSVFSSSLPFCENGRWYHLQLCNPKKNYRGGYGWVECTASVHHEYVAIISGHRRTLDDAVSATAS